MKIVEKIQIRQIIFAFFGEKKFIRIIRIFRKGLTES